MMEIYFLTFAKCCKLPCCLKYTHFTVLNCSRKLFLDRYDGLQTAIGIEIQHDETICYLVSFLKKDFPFESKPFFLSEATE